MGRRRTRLPVARARHRGDRCRRWRGFNHRLGTELARLRHHDEIRLGGAEGALPQAAGARHDARLLLPERAARRLRRRGDPQQRAPRRRPVGAQRRQAVHYHRQGGRCGHRLRRHRQERRQEGHLLLPGADQRPRLYRRPDRGEDGPARLGHGTDTVRGLPRTRRSSARRGRRGLPHRACRTWRAGASASPRSASAWRVRRWRRQ